MKRFIKILCITFLSINIHAFDGKDEFISKLSTLIPEGATIVDVTKTPVEGVFKLDLLDMQSVYVSADGNFLIIGEIFQITNNKLINLTEFDRDIERKDLIADIDKSELISFTAANEIFSVTIFTDIDCGYCRKLHSEISEYNKLGISINYAAFPRSGLQSESYSKIVGAWCSNDPKKTLTALKQGKNIYISDCDDHPVEKHYRLGRKIGVTGTPAIISDRGQLIPGYVPAEELLKRLQG
jgi:thiol:disulfide interchange protein DsbC